MLWMTSGMYPERTRMRLSIIRPTFPERSEKGKISMNR